MKKYFIIECSDGRIWNIKNKTAWLTANDLMNLDRPLRDAGWHNDGKSGLSYKCEKVTVKNLDGIEFQEIIKDDSVEFENVEQEDYNVLLNEYRKLIKQNQKYKDLMRIARRENRFDDRIETVFEQLCDFLKENVEKFTPNEARKIKEDISTKEGIIHLSDLHFGEYIKDKYDYSIAKEKLDELFSEAVIEFNRESISSITLMFTGDLINASNHMDKMLTNLKTRGESLKILFKTLSSNIDYLLNEGFIVNVCSVVGNESRIDGFEKMSSTNEIAVNNFDYLFAVLLEARYEDSITFLNESNTLEDMITINDKSFILCHGDNLKQSSEKILSEEVLKLKKKWFNKTGIMADYAIFGHLHAHWISTTFARSGSLGGGNGYSENALNIPDSFSSQNIYVVGKKIKAIPIFLD